MERKFLQNEVYHLNYTIVTELNSTSVPIQLPPSGSITLPFS